MSLSFPPHKPQSVPERRPPTLEKALPQAQHGEPIKFLRVGDDLIRLDMVVRIKECRNDETFYGKSVRKTTDKSGWIELHFVSGDVLKLDGPLSVVLRRYLDQAHQIQDLASEE